jgi:hypothetical protein
MAAMGRWVVVLALGAIAACGGPASPFGGEHGTGGAAGGAGTGGGIGGAAPGAGGGAGGAACVGPHGIYVVTVEPCAGTSQVDFDHPERGSCVYVAMPGVCEQIVSCGSLTGSIIWSADGEHGEGDVADPSSALENCRALHLTFVRPDCPIAVGIMKITWSCPNGSGVDYWSVPAGTARACNGDVVGFPLVPTLANGRSIYDWHINWTASGGVGYVTTSAGNCSIAVTPS